MALGPTTASGTPKTSLSLFSVGNGTVAIFGDAPRPAFTYSAEDVIAHDIARLLVSGLLENPDGNRAILMSTANVQTGAGGEAEVPLSIASLGDARIIRVVVQSLVDHDPLLAVKDVSP